jgi:hypothetical protein
MHDRQRADQVCLVGEAAVGIHVCGGSLLLFLI